jgi:hypothetical protein
MDAQPPFICFSGDRAAISFKLLMLFSMSAQTGQYWKARGPPSATDYRSNFF